MWVPSWCSDFLPPSRDVHDFKLPVVVCVAVCIFFSPVVKWWHVQGVTCCQLAIIQADHISSSYRLYSRGKPDVLIVWYKAWFCVLSSVLLNRIYFCVLKTEHGGIYSLNPDQTGTCWTGNQHIERCVFVLGMMVLSLTRLDCRTDETGRWHTIWAHLTEHIVQCEGGTTHTNMHLNAQSPFGISLVFLNKHSVALQIML